MHTRSVEFLLRSGAVMLMVSLIYLLSYVLQL